MNNTNVYLIKATSAKGFEGELPETIQDQILKQFSKILDDTDQKNVVCEEFNNTEWMFLRLSKMKVMRICSILEPYVNFELVDISGDIIKGDTEQFNFIISNSQFKSFFESYRLEIAGVDDVLDKISLKGIDSLDEIDKIILSK